MDKISHTVDFLGEFSTAGKFKQVTHRFELDSKQDYLYYVNKCRTSLLNYEGLLPDGLFSFLFGFFFGPEWKDANGKTHREFCGCEKWVEWCVNNPGVHPWESKESFRDEIADFKSSIRVYGGDLPKYIEELRHTTNRLSIDYDKKVLRNFDAYTDVSQLKMVLSSIINDIDTSPYSKEHPSVTVISYKEKNKLPNDVYLDTICIENRGSFPPQQLSSVISHFQGTGGFLSTLKKLGEGYFYISVDAIWGDDKPLRWNLIGLPNSPEIESLSAEETPILGFRYNIRVPHKA
jgi:hypothetical protein